MKNIGNYSNSITSIAELSGVNKIIFGYIDDANKSLKTLDYPVMILVPPEWPSSDTNFVDIIQTILIGVKVENVAEENLYNEVIKKIDQIAKDFAKKLINFSDLVPVDFDKGLKIRLLPEPTADGAYWGSLNMKIRFFQ